MIRRSFLSILGALTGAAGLPWGKAKFPTSPPGGYAVFTDGFSESKPIPFCYANVTQHGSVNLATGKWTPIGLPIAQEPSDG